MSEVAEAPAQQQDAAPSAGTLLRLAREGAGVHIAAVAVALKVPVRKIEALEEDRWQELGDAVFVRGLASSVCRTLKVDPQPILGRLPQSGVPRLVKENEGLNAPFRAPGDGPSPTLITRVRQPVPAAVIALLLAAGVVYFLPTAYREERNAARETPAPAPAATAHAAMAMPIAPPEPAPAASAVAAAPASIAPVPAAATARPAVLESAAPGAAAPASQGIVVIRTRGESWVEVVDAKGAVPLRKLMAAGESAGAGGALPLQVTIGNAVATDVDVRGARFDLRPVSRDNVAHFRIQ